MKGRSRLAPPLLLVLIMLAFGLRVYHLDAFSFWQDEGLTPLRSGYAIAEILSNRITIQEGVTRDTHPPFYYLVIHLTAALWGESDFAYRYPSVLGGVLLIPLLYQLGRRLHGRAAGSLAAALAAFNPANVWYAQEARMYTLLALLAAAASLVLWRALAADRPSPSELLRRLLLYLLFAGLAVYTHYTAIFLLIGQGVIWAWLFWRHGQRRLIFGGLVLAVALAVPLIPFTVPRLLTGAEANYHYVPPGIMLQDIVHGFGMGLTVDFSQLGIKLLDLGVLIVLLLGVAGPRPSAGSAGLSRLFVLSLLLAPVLGLMAGSLIKPMYMGVRHIFAASPAFFLLAARGVLALPPRLPARLAALALVAAGPFISLANLYFDPAYAKDDLRAMVGYVERRAGDNDLALYNNAILLPIHWHYRQRPELAVTALPVYPRPADASAEQQLTTWAGVYDRVWLVPDPPADGRDPTGLVQSWLEGNARRLEGRSFNGRTMTVNVVGYQVEGVATATLPPNSQPIGGQWPGWPRLEGVTLDFDQPAAMPTLWLDLLWAGGEPPPAEQELRFTLSDQNGVNWLDSSQPLRLNGAQAWPATGLARLTFGLEVPPGTPPGPYELATQAWRPGGGDSVADWQRLVTLELAPTEQWPVDPGWPISGGGPIRFANGLELLGIADRGATVRPGHPLPVTLYWRRSEMADNAALVGLRYEVEVLDPRGEPVRLQGDPVGPAWLPPDQWPAGSIIAQPAGFYFPPESRPGRYRLRWRLLADEQTVSGRPGWRPWAGSTQTLGEITVEPWPLITDTPANMNLVGAAFGPAIELLGYRLEPTPPAAGQSQQLTLYWRANATPGGYYVAFVHVVDGDGELVAQEDRIPVEGLRPTTGWRPGEVLTDVYRLALPANLATGQYRLLVGLYDADSGERLPVSLAGVAQPDSALPLTTVVVP
jgi:hypothetical protein